MSKECEEEFKKSMKELEAKGYLTCYVCGQKGTITMRPCCLCGKQICHKHQRCLEIKDAGHFTPHQNYFCPKCWPKVEEALKELNISF